MTKRLPTSWMLATGVALVQVWAPSAHAQSRGELLYATHCTACHTSQIHWRDNKLATDWNSLAAEVRRWQTRATLGWNEDDVLQVTHHLNEHFYRFPRPVARLGPRLMPAVPAPG
ncbi:MAG: cytochrome C [Cytophagales bacterium]|nr:cytochrome C [Rhizobacter sp.]